MIEFMPDGELFPEHHNTLVMRDGWVVAQCLCGWLSTGYRPGSAELTSGISQEVHSHLEQQWSIHRQPHR